jgi:membrane-associated phospholipid phosphatase
VPAILVWLYTRRLAHYRYLRTVLVVTTLIDLPLVLAFPEAPPRFALDGIVDYMATYDILGGVGSRIPRPGVNALAAMPSMHVAWTTWCAYAVWSALGPHRPRAAWLAWLFPVVTALVVLATGHHYVLDILGGTAVVAIAVWVTRLSIGHPRSSVSRRRPGAGS